MGNGKPRGEGERVSQLIDPGLPVTMQLPDQGESIHRASSEVSKRLFQRREFVKW